MAIYGKTPTALLLDKINTTAPAPVPLTEFNCTIGVPVTIPITAEGYNTEVKVSGIQGRGYIGVTTFQYKRLDLSLLFKNAAPVIDSPIANTIFNGLPNLNARYGMNFTTDDVVNRSLQDGYQFTLTAQAKSLQYTGSIVGRYNNAGYRLNDIIYMRNLDTYNHPVSTEDLALHYRSGGMIGYAIDYTDEANVITAMVAGPMGTGANFTSGNSEALKQTMVGFGFPDWDYSKASIALYAAGIIKAANPKYLVAVITDVVDNNIKGPIYLHYNLQ
jgi:hypothetical protein